MECPTNILVLQILWATAAMPSVVALTMLPMICRRMKKSPTYKFKCDMSNRFLTVIIMIFLAMFIIFTCALKIVCIRSSLIGIDKTITFSYCITNILAYICLCFFQYQNFEQVLLAKAAVLRSSQKIIKKFLNSIREITNYVPHISLYVLFMASPFLGQPSEGALDTKRIIFYAFFAINISMNVFTGHTALRMKRSIHELFVEIKTTRQSDFLQSQESLRTIEDRLYDVRQCKHLRSVHQKNTNARTQVQNEILTHTLVRGVRARNHIPQITLRISLHHSRVPTSYLLNTLLLGKTWTKQHTFFWATP